MSEILSRLKGLVDSDDLSLVSSLTEIILGDKREIKNKELYLLSELGIYDDSKLTSLCGEIYRIKFKEIDIFQIANEITKYYSTSCFVPIKLDEQKNVLELTTIPENIDKLPKPYKSYSIKVIYSPFHMYIKYYRKRYKKDLDFIKPLPIGDIFNLIVSEAIKLKASDITISETIKGVKIYFNINKRQVESKRGFFLNKSDIPNLIILLQMKSGLTTSSETKKILYAGLPLNSDYKGRTVINYTINGYMITIRLLSNKISTTTRKELNISFEVIEFSNKHLLNLKPGLKILAGPTMSGKNTFLHAVLYELYKSYHVKIVSIENPVEILSDFVEQIEVNTENELIESVQSLLRQNPDVIYIGEIGNPITAKLALELANTGKSVFTTLHANGVAEVPSRIFDLTNWSIDRIMMVLDTIIFQRLIPKICPICNDIGKECPECYKSGMIPINHYLHIDENIRKELMGLSLTESYNKLNNITSGKNMLKTLYKNNIISQRTINWLGLEGENQ